MITGYNTDVEHDGVVYHVQTEDKGLDKPFILSLVYMGGEILASKRSPYTDLNQSGFDEGTLTERLQRQHKLICAAIHAGRIDELKKMSQREQPINPPAQNQAEPVAPPLPVFTPTFVPPPARAKPYSPPRTRIAVSREEDSDALRVRLIDEQRLRAGETPTLRIAVFKPAGDTENPVKKARVSVRVLGSTFRPVKVSATTNKDGIAEVNIAIPDFNSGRAAMLIRAESNQEVAELRRVIQRAEIRR